MMLVSQAALRLQDVLRESRIEAKKAEVLRLRDAGQMDQAREAMQALCAEIDQRSPAQVERMERARGLRV